MTTEELLEERARARRVMRVLAYWFAIPIIIAVTAITAYTMYQHLETDHQTLHQMIGLINYNLQQGKMVPVPAVALAPPSAEPPKAPEKTEKK